MVRKVTLFDLTCRVLAPDEFRDVRRYLDPLLISTPAVGSKRNKNLVLSNELTRLNYHRELFGKLTFRALALRQSEVVQHQMLLQ